MVKRIATLEYSNSFFLFGARGTGKTTLLKEWTNPETTLSIDLLDPDEESLLSREPNELVKRINAFQGRLQWVVIDEIQKLPTLLDIVHSQIENSSVHFALTGSSARKLKRGHANLLAGRAFVKYLFPFTHRELGETFDLDKALQVGTLPKIFQYTTESKSQAFLRAYANTYLKEEVWGEQLIRHLDPFRRFLEVAAQVNGEIINYTNIARDVGVDTKTVQSYFQILEDTLTGYLLEPYHRSLRKRQRQNPKFYFFDLGVKRALERTLTLKLLPRTYAYGKAFEHFLILEMHRLSSYLENDFQFSYLRTKDGVEIDMIIDRPGLPTALVEIKSTEYVDERDIRHLEPFLKDFGKCEAYCLSLDPNPKKIGSVMALPWQKGLRELGL